MADLSDIGEVGRLFYGCDQLLQLSLSVPIRRIFSVLLTCQSGMGPGKDNSIAHDDFLSLLSAVV